MQAEHHQARVAGTVLHWRHWPRAGGRAVLALHCSLSHGGEWSGLARERAELAIFAPDMSGHGKMPVWDGQADLHRESTDLAIALASRIGQGGPVDVIGHSFGGTVALRLVQERPEVVRRLVLVEPVIFAAAKGEVEIWSRFQDDHRLFETMLDEGRLQEALDAFLAIWGSGSPMEQLVPTLADYMRQRIALVGAQDAVLSQDAAGLLAPGRLEAVACPVLLVEGQESPDVVAAIHRALAARLPQVQRVAVPGARHMLTVTHVKPFAAAVGAFLGA
jgi:lipase